MTVPRRLLVRPPVLRSNEGERASSWLELFFDLVFVSAITQLGVALAEDVSVRGLLRFALLFVPIWWSWVGYTNYADRFDSDDVTFRLVMLAGMLGMTVVSVAVPDTFGHRSSVFAGAYVVVRVLLIVLYGRARRHVPEARPLCNATMAVFIVGAALWLVSLAIPEPWRFLLWGAALLIEGATPWIARRAMLSVPYHASHLPERYGLFTLIVLGESLVAIVVGVGDTDWLAAAVVAAGLGFVCAAALWWLYFDSIEDTAIRRSLLARNTFIYGHLLVAAGLAVTGVGIKETILHATEAHQPAAERWALCGGVALFLLAQAAIHGVAIHAVRDRAVQIRVVAGVLVLVVGLAGGGLDPVLRLAVVTALLVAAAALDVLAPTVVRDQGDIVAS